MSSALRRVLLLGSTLLCSVATDAQPLKLPPEAEGGFRKLIRMAQAGELGSEVHNANVSVAKESVTVELVTSAGRRIVLLSPKKSNQALSRYFDLQAGEGAGAEDVARVGRALDAAFERDPFELNDNFFEALPGQPPLPSLRAAWSAGGWPSVRRVLAQRLTELASREYTMGVIATLLIGSLASIAVLWGAAPQRAER